MTRAEQIASDCTGYEHGCHCDDCTFIDADDPRSNGYITWEEA